MKFDLMCESCQGGHCGVLLHDWVHVLWVMARSSLAGLKGILNTYCFPK